MRTHYSPCQMLVIKAIVINTEIVKKCYSQSCICTYIYIHTHKHRKTVDLISIDYIITTVTKTIIICFHQFGFPVHEHDMHFCERTHKFVLKLVIIFIDNVKMMQKQFHVVGKYKDTLKENQQWGYSPFSFGSLVKCCNDISATEIN